MRKMKRVGNEGIKIEKTGNGKIAVPEKKQRKKKRREDVGYKE